MSRMHDALKKTEQERPYRRISIEELDVPATGPIPVSPTVDTDPASSSFVSTSNPVERDTLLAQFPPPTRWKPNTKTMLFLGPEEPVNGPEEFRTLRSRLYQLREKQSLQRILITSSLPQEGKSFVAGNLAQILALQPKCRVLLIDADLRNPSLHLNLGTPPSPGLAEYLLNETEEFDIVQRGSMENLFFVSAGRPVSGQAEIFSNGRLKQLLDRVEGLFDWIIVDSPAAVPVSDACLIANVCDGALMVVRSNVTPFDVVRNALRKLPGALVMGVVLNGIPPETDFKIQRYYAAS